MSKPEFFVTPGYGAGGLLLAKIFGEAGLRLGVLSVVAGPGSVIAAA